MPPYKENAAYPIAKLSQEGLDLPSGVKLSDDDLKKIVNICVLV
jgi:hypothetical protein